MASLVAAVAGGATVRKCKERRWEEDLARAARAQKRREEESRALAVYYQRQPSDARAGDRKRPSRESSVVSVSDSSTPSAAVDIPPSNRSSHSSRQSSVAPADRRSDSSKRPSTVTIERSNNSTNTSVATSDCSHALAKGEQAKQLTVSVNQDEAPRTPGELWAAEHFADCEMTGFSRFRHVASASPRWIKAKLEEEISGPGALNFFGVEALPYVNPWEQKYLAHRKSADSDGSSSTFTAPTLYENPRDRLERRLRTPSSTTLSADGCRVTKGFEVNSRPSTPVSLTSDQSPDISRPQSPEGLELPRRKPARRITWNEQSITTFHRDEPANTVCPTIAESKAGAEPHVGTPAPWKQDLGIHRAPSSSPNLRFKGKPVPYITPPPSHDARGIVKKVDSKIRIVSAEEAEEAIATDDETASVSFASRREIPIQLKQSRRLPPPKKGILKTPFGRSDSSTSSNIRSPSAQSARIGPEDDAVVRSISALQEAKPTGSKCFLPLA